jgi:transposase
MPRTLTLHPHLTADELFTAYKAASDPATARRWHALWLIATGRSAKDAAAIVGLSADWLRDLVHRYNQQGPAGLQDRRATNPGKAPRLSPHQQQTLATLLTRPAPDGGLWTGPKVAAWIAQQTGQPALPQLGWDYLRRLGFTVQTPRPRHTEAASPEEQEAWKKNSTTR